MMSAQGIGITTDEKQKESAEKNLADPFDLFTKPGIEQDHVSKEEVKFRPSLEVKDGAPIEFEIKTHGQYLEGDSLQAEFFLKIENADGTTAVDATDDVAPINAIAATLWKNIKVSFRNVSMLVSHLNFYLIIYFSWKLMEQKLVLLPGPILLIKHIWMY